MFGRDRGTFHLHCRGPLLSVERPAYFLHCSLSKATITLLKLLGQSGKHAQCYQLLDGHRPLKIPTSVVTQIKLSGWEGDRYLN